MALAELAIKNVGAAVSTALSQQESTCRISASPSLVSLLSSSPSSLTANHGISSESRLHSSFMNRQFAMTGPRKQAAVCRSEGERGIDRWRCEIGPGRGEQPENRQRVQAVATSASEPSTRASPPQQQEEEDEAFACPICYSPLIRYGPKGLTRRAVGRSRFRCQRCRRAFPSQGGYLDLVITSGVKEYREPLPPGTELFRSPLVSFVYERGWRQNFARAGFPGADEEFQMAQRYLEPAKGGLLLDVSCGSGLFSRRFTASGDYSAVVASDFSENMLRQAAEFITEDRTLSAANVVLLRADVARLPFATASVDGVHAGAALHCWPSPSLAVSEISRILKPGGVFVATTFLAPRAPFGDEFVKPIRQAVAERQPRGMKYWEAEELEELCAVCGLVDYIKDQRRDFIMLTARKPE